MQFEIEFEVGHLERVLEAVRREIATPEEMLDSIGESLLRVNRRRHEQGVDPEGKAWKKLSSLTLAEGNRKGGPLKKTGRMLASLNYQVSANTLILGFDGQRDSMLAAIHNAGADPYVIRPRTKKALAFAGIVRKRVNHPGLPKRELVGFPDSDKNLVENVTVDHLTRVLTRVR
ncbi:phage virion morphogenesis protein [Methylomonas rapida]|uniref:Phage virion morphogenesis protein n=1 Tax=Methylomonas rapida TaxID=2963939 RepID=A0ABY7GFM9_9GAMM|nr:phage virion morphogenesis protein [Methylomonas rapida]WAR43639.1 phage virion morphogenesis protein [Methylomonas rapida]WAR45513.1 phage virion morphogenesis protein [Methylomonas rapida]